LILSISPSRTAPAVLPLVDREAVFALKGGTAINFFVRDLPRVSVDIDLVYLPIGERDSSSASSAPPWSGSPVMWRAGSRDEDHPQEAQRDRPLERLLGSASGCRYQDRAEPGHARLALSSGTQDPVSEGPERIRTLRGVSNACGKGAVRGKLCAALDANIRGTSSMS